MNRAEFMRRLTELLGDVSPMEREEAIQYYNDYFDDAGVENESGVIASLGTPEELARTIKAGLSDGGNGGEFTESGFSGYTQAHRDEMIRAGETAGSTGAAGGTGNAQDGNPGAAAGGGTQSDNAYYQGGYYQRSGSDSVYGGREDTRKRENPYERANTGNTANHSGGAASYAGGSSGGQYAQPKKGMSGGTIAAIVILAVLTSPVWIGLLGAFFGVAAALLATLFGIFLAFLGAGIGMIVVAIALLITGFALLFSVPLGGLCVLGAAFIVFAIGLVFIWLMVLMAGTAIPAFVRGCVSLCQRMFGRGGARA